MGQSQSGELVAAVAASPYRRTVLEHLVDDGPDAPGKIAEATGVEIAHVSRALGQLQDVDGVELLVPEETRKGRVYGPTDAGERALATLRGE